MTFHPATAPMILLLLLTASLSATGADHPDQKRSLPDLVVTKARTDHECRLIVTVSNNGQGMLDLSYWNKKPTVDLTIERNNKFWSAADLKTIDPGQQLVHPGSSVEYRTALIAPPQRPENIALVIDRKNQVQESNEQNNRQNYAMVCTLPDLVISRIYLNQSCELMVEVKNAGNGELQSSAYDKDGPMLTIKHNAKTREAKTLLVLDPHQALKSPGGTLLYRSNLKPGQQPEKIQALIDQKQLVRETDEKNNVRSVTLACPST